MNKKCSQEEHKENNAIGYCQECNLYMCNKCDNYHSMLFKNHNKYSLDKNINEIFTGFCQGINHNKELKYFCKEHNKLCCAVCICKIKDKENGQHSDCNVCSIDEIKDEKLSKLKENIKYLENIYLNLEKYIDDSKQMYNKILEEKEKIKTEIQKIFTKLRNEINNREDKLIEETDKIFDKLMKEDTIKTCEKLPNKIKLILDKNQKIDENIKDANKIKSFINDSINIENYVKDINNIYESIKNVNENEMKIQFNFEEKELKNILEKLYNFGKLYNKKDIIFEIESCIINDKNNLNFVIEQIKIKNNIQLNQPINLNLLYRASKDGDDCQTYHQKTNNIPDTLTILKTKNDIVFGGYTNIKIPSSYGENFKDDKAFIFSLDNKKLYFPKKGKFSKHSNDNYGPIFGSNIDHGYPIIIRGKYFFSNQNHQTCIKDCSYDNLEIDYELNKGNKNFEVSEIEFYKITFE